MSHYYINDPNLKSDYQTIDYTFQGHRISLQTDTGLFSRNRVDFGTNLLLNQITEDLNEKSVLDIGCGYGIIGIAIAKAYPDAVVEMTDVNERAVHLAEKNALENHVKPNIYVSNLYENTVSDFDLILSNPPIRAGKTVVHKIIEDGYRFLKPGGRIRAVIQKKQGAMSLMKKMEEIYSQVTVLAKEKGYFLLESKKSK